MNAIFTGTDPYRDENGNIILYKLIRVKSSLYLRIEETVREHFKDYKPPFIKNHKWTGEDGQKYSSWTFNTGKNSTHTGDGGAEMIFKELQKQGFTLPNFNNE